MCMKQGDEIRGKQKLGENTKAAFQLGWFPFFFFFKGWICKPNDADVVLMLVKTGEFGKGPGMRP